MTLHAVAPLPDAHVWTAPRGWEALAALGPLDRTDAPCHVCGAHPVVIGPRVAHCIAHPPQAGEWGANLDWTPKDKPCLPGACYCGRCPHAPRPPRHHLTVAH